MLTITEILTRVLYRWQESSSDLTILRASKYGRVLITLQSSGSINQYDLFQFIGIMANPNQTIASFISGYNKPLPNPMPNILTLNNKKSIHYYSLWDYGLVANLTNLSNNVLSQNHNNLPDISITKSNSFASTLDSLYQKVMFIVNGIILSDTNTPDLISIPNGGLELTTSKEPNIGVLDFSDLGGFIKVPITPNNVSVFKQTNEYITLHIQTNPNAYSSVGLVLNGRLHLFEDIYKVLDNNVIAVSFLYSDIVKEAFNSNLNTLDWIRQTHSNDLGFDLSTFDPVKYLTRSNSFIFYIENGYLSKESLYIEPLGFPYAQKTNEDTTDIIFNSDGTIAHYVVDEYSAYSYTVLTVTNPRCSSTISDTVPVIKNSLVSSRQLKATSSSYANRVRLVKLYTL